MGFLSWPRFPIPNKLVVVQKNQRVLAQSVVVVVVVVVVVNVVVGSGRVESGSGHSRVGLVWAQSHLMLCRQTG